MIYCTSRLALLRKAKNLTQTEAAALFGMRTKQHLCGIERGWRMASPELMRAMQEAYGASAREILRAAVETFDAGPIMSRQNARRKKLAPSRK